MKRYTPPRSETVKEVRYDPNHQRLEVDFHKGTTYHYANVPESIFDRLTEAPSAGSFLHKEVYTVFQGQKATPIPAG